MSTTIEEGRQESADEKSWTEEFGHGTAPLSTIDFNTSDEQLEREREMIFRHEWFMVGRLNDIPETGDYFVQEIPTLHTSVLVVRGKDKKVRAFHNMCRHRGNKVVHAGTWCGKAKGFSCAFHGWTYDLEGKLVIVPDEDQFFDFDKSRHGLTPLSCDNWEGFVFIAFEPRQSLKEFLGGLEDQFGGYFEKGDKYGDTRCFAYFTSDIHCNWKIIVDAFDESYHVPFIHGKTLPEVLSGEGNPLCRLQSVRLYDRHHSLSMPTNPDYRPSKMEMAVAKFIDMPVFPAVKADLDKLPKGVNPERNPFWAFDIHQFFPMTVFMEWANGMLVLYNFWPIDVEWTRWEVKLYMKRPRNVAEWINQEVTRAMGVSVVREDMSSLETTQETLRSGASQHIHLSDQEVGVRHRYQAIAKACGLPGL